MWHSTTASSTSSAKCPSGKVASLGVLDTNLRSNTRRLQCSHSHMVKSNWLLRTNTWNFGSFHIGGFHQWGYPKNGWFLLGTIPSFEMDDNWGYPHLWKPPYSKTWKTHWFLSAIDTSSELAPSSCLDKPGSTTALLQFLRFRKLFSQKQAVQTL